MGSVRQFREDDIPRIVELNCRLFPGSSLISRDVQAEKFREIAFRNPWYDSGIASLVHEEADGTISGFLGIVPRSLILNGRPVTAAVGQHLMAERSGLAGFLLFRKMLSGPQDLSYSDMAVDVARVIWERSGGFVSFAHSVYWRRPIRPSSMLIGLTRQRRGMNWLGITAPLCALADGIAGAIPGSPLLPPAEKGIREEELTVSGFLECIEQLPPQRMLKPVYTAETAAWLFSMLEQERRFGSLRKSVIRDESGALCGWYIIQVKSGGKCEVLQIGFRPKMFPVIFRLILRAAWSGGSAEVIGRLDPLTTSEMPRLMTFFNPGRNWMLIHSREPELLRLVDSGNVFLSRMEGDLWFF